MQIPSSIFAAGVSAVGNAKTERAATNDAPPQSAAHVEGSNQSNQDRDAQGQADGLPAGDDRGRQKKPSPQPVPAEAIMAEGSQPAPTLPDEPPSQLDLFG